MNLPPMAWMILALGVAWLLIRTWTRRIEERRRQERDARIEQLYAEREAMQPEGAPQSMGPSSLAAVVSDSTPPSRGMPARDGICLGCKTVNATDASTCSGCGLEL